MNDYVTDTHAFYWYLLDSALLSANASAAFEEADNGNALIHVPVIVLAELFYTNVKLENRIDFSSTFQKIKESGQFILTPFEADDVLDFDRDSAVAEMHDRMIVGLARRLDAPLITKDTNIKVSGLVSVVW